MPVLGGQITDRIGVCTSALVFAALVVFGSLGLWAAVVIRVGRDNRLTLMTCSMVLFGVGAESLTVSLKAMLAVWFENSDGFPQLAFATSLALTFGYSAVVANRWLEPSASSVPQAYLLCVLICGGSLASLGGAYAIHRRDLAKRAVDDGDSALPAAISPLGGARRLTFAPRSLLQDIRELPKVGTPCRQSVSQGTSRVARVPPSGSGRRPKARRALRLTLVAWSRRTVCLPRRSSSCWRRRSLSELRTSRPSRRSAPTSSWSGGT